MTYVTIMMGKHNYAGIFAIMVMYPQNGIMSSTARSHTGVTHTHTHPHTHPHPHTHMPWRSIHESKTFKGGNQINIFRT